MATVFDRIVFYCEENHKCIVGIDKRREIGELVKKKWYKIMGISLPTTKKTQPEPDGMAYDVVDYPVHFIAYMDEVVDEYYHNLRNNRKKIPVRNSLKNKHPNGNSHAA